MVLTFHFLLMRQYRFVREGAGWFIDLPEYLAAGGSKGDLAMVAGADTMLDTMAAGKNEVEVELDTDYFPHADELALVEVCDPSLGGGYYVLQTYLGQPLQHRMWLCAVTEFVFGDLPEKIYVRRIS